MKCINVLRSYIITIITIIINTNDVIINKANVKLLTLVVCFSGSEVSDYSKPLSIKESFRLLAIYVIIDNGLR